MAFLGQEFSTEQLPAADDFSPVPAGEYRVKVAKVELRDTESGGQLLNFRLDIIGPSHEGRVIFDRVNIRNASEKAQEIGLKQLRAYMDACGLARTKDTDDFVGHECIVRVTIRKSDEYGDKNQVKSVKKVGGSKPTATTPVASDKPPWAT